MEDLEEKEQRLKFLQSKVDGEIFKFKTKLSFLDGKMQEIKLATKTVGHEPIPITFTSANNNHENVYDLIKAHLLELDNLKNYLSIELEKIASQKKILKNLDQKYGESVSVVQNSQGGFTVNYSDDDIEKIKEDALMSKKLVTSLKDSVFKK